MLPKIMLLNQDTAITYGDIVYLLFPFGFDLPPYGKTGVCSFPIPVFKDMNELKLAVSIPYLRSRIPNQSGFLEERHELVSHPIPS